MLKAEAPTTLPTHEFLVAQGRTESNVGIMYLIEIKQRRPCALAYRTG